MTLGWVPAPEGEVLTAGNCRARDEDGQGCAHGLVHLSAHQSTGLRAWLEANRGRALIRAYEAVDADRLEAMEAPLFAQFELVPIARQDLVHTEEGGLNTGWALIVGPLFAPTQKVKMHLRLVCFGPPYPSPL
jgi:hypothetical protein